MDKQGALYFKLLTGVFLLVLAGYGLGRLWPREPAYELYNTRICEVGDGITVSGFVVRSETPLYSIQAPAFLSQEGQWIGGGQAVATTASGSLRVSQSGYLSYGVDGYEEILTPHFLLNCKAEQLHNLSPASPSPYAVGRMIHGQTWYFAVPGDFSSPSLGEYVTLSIGELACQAKVLRTQGLLVLECNSYCHLITHLRTAEATLILSSAEGIPIPKEAIYYEKGESCVYVLQGAQARRKTVHILHIREDLLWIQPTDLPEGSRIIVTETEITDGMVLP